MMKEDYKKALEEGRIYIVGTKFTRNGWTHFDVYECKNYGDTVGMERITVPSAYWRESTGDYACSAWGTSRTLEIILAIGYKLGLYFHDIKQNYRTLN